MRTGTIGAGRISRLAIIGIALVWLCASYAPVFAMDMWTSGSFTLGDDETHVNRQACATRLVSIAGVRALPETASVCVYERPHWRYALYNKRIDLGYMTRYEYYFIVGIGGDSSMYAVSNMSGERYPVEVSGSNDLVFNSLTMGFTNNHHLTVINNFPSKLELVRDEFNIPKHYTLKSDAEQPLISRDQGEAITTGAVGVSHNGK